ncbi:hypothetical protein DCAR_0623367 [Daucus carota subsp. sativus]|uniref:Uncharacterized protein n=1 Tax=Daucus carota subsp. sativus TaxID=79200 RepID=A0A175YAA6_DAUCS|nr:hypothetical protein DCAR_0623367 [Daucus carota subsp. sativus]
MKCCSRIAWFFSLSRIAGLLCWVLCSFLNPLLLNLVEMKIKELMPMDVKSRKLIDWMEKGNRSSDD